MLIFHTDAGHAWLEVPIADYPDAIDHGTGYGFQKGWTIYLEQDCEAPSFLRAHPEISSTDIKHESWIDDAPCRKYPSNKNNMKMGQMS